MSNQAKKPSIDHECQGDLHIYKADCKILLNGCFKIIHFPVTVLLEYYTASILFDSLTALLEYLDVSSGIVQIAAYTALR